MSDHQGIHGNIGKLKVELFPDELIALNEEVGKHPDLMARLGQQPDKDVYVLLGEIAAHLKILLDGTYTQGDILILCTMMRLKLVEKRTGIILSS